MVRLKVTHLIALFALLSVATCVSYRKILLSQVQVLTLSNGAYTTARRGNPIPQIKCIGGSAYNRFTPKSVQCYNRGSDGVDVQWECKADMPKKYRFGQISVSCEGFDHPGDPYVLHGSCGLEYNLEYNDDYKSSDSSDSVLFYIVLILFALFIVYIFIRGPVRDAPDGGFNGHGGPGYPGGGGPPPPGFHPPPSAPPPYTSADPNTKRYQSSSGTAGAYEPGFWTGAGLGALGGYMFGSRAIDKWCVPPIVIIFKLNTYVYRIRRNISALIVVTGFL
ncbi:hypothetical protein QR680_000629 [Steinernema hermaphroditum]|uniref:Store-operated calcium entry-associated regulatory factor n=1 Tax=Steinernema hermaphroditum TaxID=289476 RepID=A0AA39LEM1_9BILA|nr:hypothetical protein QR680_000629 [Steinernema hermaphroditum]